MKEELIFESNDQRLKVGVYFDLSGKDRLFVSGALSYILNLIDDLPFIYSGIDLGAIDSFVSSLPKDLKSLLDHKKEFNSAIRSTKQNLRPAAYSYAVRSILKKCTKRLTLPRVPTPDHKTIEPHNRIGLIFNYPPWTLIKKTSLDGAEDWEKAGIYTNIYSSIWKKAFVSAGEDLESSEKRAIESTKGKRKNLESVVDLLSSNLSDFQVLLALEKLKIYVQPSLEMLVKEYPDLKISMKKKRKRRKKSAN